MILCLGHLGLPSMGQVLCHLAGFEKLWISVSVKWNLFLIVSVRCSKFCSWRQISKMEASTAKCKERAVRFENVYIHMCVYSHSYFLVSNLFFLISLEFRDNKGSFVDLWVSTWYCAILAIQILPTSVLLWTLSIAAGAELLHGTTVSAAHAASHPRGSLPERLCEVPECVCSCEL